MNFDLDNEQEEFARTAREYYARQDSVTQARRQLDVDEPPSPGLKSLADMGFYGITVPEQSGGACRHVIDLVVVAEQAGRYLSAPSLATAARAAVLLADDEVRSAALSDGSTAFAVIDGSAPCLDGAWAEQFISYRDGTVVVGGGDVTRLKPLDASRGLARVRLQDDAVSLMGGHELWLRAGQIGGVVLAAEDLGAATQVLDLTLEHVRLRTAFGRAIGSYQAIKHALVDVYSDIEQLRSLVWWAAWAADFAPNTLPIAASAASAYAATAFEHAAEMAIQVHGGTGYTWEHDAHLYWRRAKVDRLLLGDEVMHLDVVAQLALASAQEQE
jgi:alkylation response protein AidB-like acyl-CoA dehydrogenase